MESKDYFHQHKECLINGIATCKDSEEIYQCGKYGGICQLSKCVNAHNNNNKAEKVLEKNGGH
jgi:hypothetical protein